MAEANLTAKYVREALSYDPDTGIFTWRVRPREHFLSERNWKAFNNRFAGTQAGYVNARGYRRTILNGRDYAMHRLAFLIQIGTAPPKEVDHINGVRDDNRWSNLRLANRQENTRNTKRYTNNTSGHIGVGWYAPRNRWRARINYSGKTITLGYYKTKDEAIQAHRQAKILYGYHPNHGR